MLVDVLDSALGYVLEVLAPALLLLFFSLLQSEMNPVLGCLALAIAVALGAAQRALWTVLILMVGTATLNLTLSATRWRSLGILDSGMTAGAGHMLTIAGVICGAGWMLGRCIPQLVRRQACFRR